MTESGKIVAVSLAMIALFALTFLLPEHTWAFHHISFLPKSIAIGILLTTVILVIVPVRLDICLTLNRLFENWSILVTGVAMGFLALMFPIANDYYGDAVKYLPHLDYVQEEVPVKQLKESLKFNLNPETARKFQLVLISLVSWGAEVPYRKAFSFFAAFVVVPFTWTWLVAVRTFCTDMSWRFVLVLSGIVSPFILVFFGHMETYALTYWILLIWLLGLSVQLKSNSKKLLWILLVALLLCIKLHPLLSLLLIGWLLAFIHSYSPKYADRIIGLSGITLFILIPIFTIGLFLYFFVFQDHIDERILRNIKPVDRLFLPIISPDPPLNRYNLFSWNHILDFMNMSFRWSPVGWFVLVAALITPKDIKFLKSSPIILTLGTLFLVFSAFLFAINPLLSMPMDWDLFSFPAIILIVLVLMIVSQLESDQVTATPRSVMRGGLALSLLIIPVFIVNTSETLLSNRLEMLGIRIFKTYYERGRETILIAQSMMELSQDEMISRKLSVVNELESYAVLGVDPSYATLATDLGIFQYSSGQDLTQALKSLQHALPYFPNHKNNHLYQVQVLFELGRAEEAFTKALKLVELGYPSASQALRIAIQMALESGLYKQANNLCEQYLQRFPDDQFISNLRRRLIIGSQLDELKFLFARKNED